VKERIAQDVEEEKIVHLLEEKYVRLDGTIIDVEVIARRFLHLIHMQCKCSSRYFGSQAAEEALKQSEGEIQDSCRAITQHDFINVKGKVVYANKACERALGYTVEELCSPNFDFFSLIAPDTEALWEINSPSHEG